MMYIKLLAVATLLGSIAWVIADPGFESSLTMVGFLSALISTFVIEKRKARHKKQHQLVSKSSIGLQAGGDINIGNIGNDKHA